MTGDFSGISLTREVKITPRPGDQIVLRCGREGTMRGLVDKLARVCTPNRNVEKPRRFFPVITFSCLSRSRGAGDDRAFLRGFSLICCGCNFFRLCVLMQPMYILSMCTSLLSLSQPCTIIQGLLDLCHTALMTSTDAVQTAATSGPGQHVWLMCLLYQQEAVDGDLAARVFSLLRSTEEGLHAHRFGERSRQRLDIAIIGFFQCFRKVYIGEQVCERVWECVDDLYRVSQHDHCCGAEVCGCVCRGMKSAVCQCLAYCVYGLLEGFQSMSALV